MPSELKVAIVGCGRMGRERARCVQTLGAGVQCVFDVDRERSSRLAQEHGARAANSWEECLAESPDAAFICIPPGLRGPIETECVERGIPLLVEKPIGLAANECKHLVLLCYKQEQFEIELFCGKESLRARPTRETLCGIHARPGQSRRTC